MTENVYMYLAPLAFIVFWSSTIFMLKRWPRATEKFLSNHAASSKAPMLLFAAAITIETILYVAFLYKWFIPYFEMPMPFGAVMGLLLFGHLVTGLVPATKGLIERIHWAAAWMVILLFFPTVLLLITTGNIPTIGRVIAALTLTILIGLVSWFRFVPSAKRKVLIVQGAFVATLPLALILISFTA